MRTKLIKVTLLNTTKPYWVNPMHILAVEKNDEKSIIRLSGKDPVYIEESAEKVAELFEQST